MHKTRCALAIVGVFALAGLSGAIAPANAAPMLDRSVAAAINLDQAKPEAVRYVCNAWGRCWWRPNRYYYRPIYRRPRWACDAWGRCWRRW